MTLGSVSARKQLLCPTRVLAAWGFQWEQNGRSATLRSRRGSTVQGRRPLADNGTTVCTSTVASKSWRMGSPEEECSLPRAMFMTGTRRAARFAEEQSKTRPPTAGGFS